MIPKLYACIITAVSSANKNLKSAGYIITGQLVRKVCLKESIVVELIGAVAAHPDPSLVREVVLTLSCILHHNKVQQLPAAAVELLLQEEFRLALALANQKSDISGLIGQLVLSVVRMSFSSGVAPARAQPLLELPDLPSHVTASFSDTYFELYFGADAATRSSAAVRLMGEMLAATFSSEIQTTFQAFHSKGCDMTVLEGLKSLILGRYLGNEASQKLLEIR